MKILIFGFIFFLCSALSVTGQAQSQPLNNADFDPEQMRAARKAMLHNSGNTTNYLILGERFESQWQHGQSSLAWEGQAWVGKDLQRLWVKTEGEGYANKNSDGQSELQLLYSHAVDPFWDLQLGLRHDFNPGHDRDYAVLGLQGLAPYWFEVDLAAFVSDSDSERGKVSARLEVEYELLFSQRLILQPRFELNYAFSADKEVNIGKGISTVSFGLRLRYELARTFAPYVGLNWQHSYGETADLLSLATEKDEEFSFVAGIRFWY